MVVFYGAYQPRILQEFIGMSHSFINFRLSELDAVTPFLFSWGHDPERMIESIRGIGLITPPVIWPSRDRAFLVCGHRRVAALRELGLSEFPAVVLDPVMEEQQVLFVALEENLSHRTFNEAEKVLAIKALKRFFTPDRIMAEYLPRLGLPPRMEFFNRYSSLDELGEAGLNALARESLDPETGENLVKLAPGDREAAISLFEALNPGRNKRREILTWLEETARREDLSFDRILDSEEIRVVLAADNMGRPQKEKKVREILRNRRYPNLTRMEKLRSEGLKALKLPAGLRLDLPPHFEGLEFTLDLTFKDMNSFNRAVSAAEKLKDNPDLAALMELG